MGLEQYELQLHDLGVRPYPYRDIRAARIHRLLPRVLEGS